MLQKGECLQHVSGFSQSLYVPTRHCLCSTFLVQWEDHGLFSKGGLGVKLSRHHESLCHRCQVRSRARGCCHTTWVSAENVSVQGPSQGFACLTANPLNVNCGKVVLGDNRKGGPNPREVRLLGKLGTDHVEVQNPSPALLLLCQLADTRWTTSTTLTTILEGALWLFRLHTPRRVRPATLWKRSYHGDIIPKKPY